LGIPVSAVQDHSLIRASFIYAFGDDSR
jgi:hypothetical protein